jgi:LCP family protein required for cell wall assembly
MYTLPIPTAVPTITIAPGAISIVVLGSDRRPEWTEWHTDAVQVVSIQPRQGVVSMLSIPRDLYVYVPGFDMNRINMADFFGETYGHEGGGLGLVRETLLYNLGIRVDHLVRTDFDGLIGIVDAVGGVDVPVHCPISDHWPYLDENGEYPIVSLEPGVHHFDGEHALWYARSRLTSSVFARASRQQQVLQSLWRKGRDEGVLSQAPALWEQMRDIVETDMALADVLDLASLAIALAEQNVRYYAIGVDEVEPWTTPYGGAVVLPRWDEIEPILTEMMAPVPEARMGRSYLAVEVWNGTHNQDWDRLAVDRLQQIGFPALVGEADRRDYAETSLIVFGGHAKGSGAEYVQQEFGLSLDRVIYAPEESSEVGFRLIVGADYRTCPHHR